MLMRYWYDELTGPSIVAGKNDAVVSRNAVVAENLPKILRKITSMH